MKHQNRRFVTKNTEKEKPQELVMPKSTPLLDAICNQRKQRINREEEKAVLGMYERNWILKDRIASMSRAESGYLRLLAKKHNSWLANQV
jgi:thymidylate kinase